MPKHTQLHIHTTTHTLLQKTTKDYKGLQKITNDYKRYGIQQQTYWSIQGQMQKNMIKMYIQLEIRVDLCDVV